MINRVVLVLGIALTACDGGGSSGPDLENRDPRCKSACIDAKPAHGEFCGESSQAACLDECEARIAGVATLCASCLVEDACLTPGGGCIVIVDDGAACDQTGCTVTGPAGSCTYPPNDEVKRMACELQVDPLTETTCTAHFRPTAECNDSCM